ncbi:hypothetical protein [Burkholderia stagnalis]|uniref:hypothetical protein n=1 Tax=Burkholderia stagnalis TaxID=1503054 RepID=UPI000F810602|nr:hypothetical protein [Burkholderia stagnalis]
MAHLTDMEELVSSVQNGDIRDYMSESLSCYMAGAYRASVVLTFIALFDDIVAKLGELGKVNKKAKTIFEAATQKRTDQEVFETFLIDQLKANSLLTALDAGFLETLRTLRNKAAHPSGHHASPEEARFVFFEAVSRFLSKPILSTTQLADEVLNSLGDANIFPSTSINVITEVVKKELKNVHPQTYPYLISKLLEKTRASDVDTSKNARFFLTGLARTGDADAVTALKKYAIEKTAANKSYKDEIISLLCSNGALFADLDEITYQRIGVLISDQIEKIELTVEHTKFSHPAPLFVSLFASNSCDFVVKKLGAQYDAFLERFTYSALFGSKILSYKEPRDLLLEKLCLKAGSNDFTTANTFARHADDIEKLMGDALRPAEAFRLLVNVIRAAEIGAFAAMDLRNAHFGAVPKLRSRAIELLENNGPIAKAVAEEILGTVEVDRLLESLQPKAEVA